MKEYELHVTVKKSPLAVAKQTTTTKKRPVSIALRLKQQLLTSKQQHQKEELMVPTSRQCIVCKVVLSASCYWGGNTRKYVKFKRCEAVRMRKQQAVDKGDIPFFELAYVEVEIKMPKKLTVAVSLKDFVIPNTELIPEEVRSKVKKWSDYVDYWAVDWNFQNDTFLQGLVTYRTRKDRALALTSDPHTYEQKGKYRILVKVIDIFGNDTSQAFDVEVK